MATTPQMTVCGLILYIFSGSHMCVCHYQELSWVLDMDHISYHPVYEDPKYRFIYTIQQRGPLGKIPFVAFNSYSTVEHMGTHVDAPYHFDPDGKHMDEVPLEDLIGPLVRIDITERASQDPDAAVSVQDLIDWEEIYGTIPSKAFVLMYSGWDKYYGDQDKYIGVNASFEHSHHPGFGPESAKWLVEKRDISGIGVDSISCDTGNQDVFLAHLYTLPAGKLCIENLKDLDKVPPSGARFAALPLRLKDGTGTQARVFAEWGTDITPSTAEGLWCSITSLVLSMCFNFLFK